MKFGEARRLLSACLLSLAAGLLPLGSLAVTVGVSDDSIGLGTVDWSERLQTDGTTRLTISAEPITGCSFAGWLVASDHEFTWTADFRYAGPLTVIVPTNTSVKASFVRHADDWLYYDLAADIPVALGYREEVEIPVRVDSRTFPTVRFSGLPPGLFFDARSLKVSGAPTEPGVYHIEATVVNASGFSFWSCADLTVANIAGSRVIGSNLEIPLDEYCYVSPSDWFAYSDEVRSVELTGLPSGMIWDSDWQVAYGTPTVPGEYTVKAQVSFVSGGQETATCVLTVASPDPAEYGVNLDCLEDLYVGDELEASECEIADLEDGLDISAVSGLPAGLRSEIWMEDGVRHWGIGGRVGKASRYRVWATVIDDSGETQRVVRTSRVICVTDVPQMYLSVVSEDESMGGVAGGGPVSSGQEVVIRASAKSGHVFAGWYDEFGEPIQFDDGTDYREPRVSFVAWPDIVMSGFRARFVATADDDAPDLTELEGASYMVDPWVYFEESFHVSSTSLPELSFKGLPSGMDWASDGTGGYVLVYDPEESTSLPKSGRYEVSLKAVNGSGRSSVISFRITVPNVAHPRIRVEDDYGEYRPCEPIDAISLAEAVDFSRGETLSVSGLPSGLVYNSKANAKTGVAAYTITGAPTVPGDYTVEFKAKIVTGATTNRSGKVTYVYDTVSTTSFLTVLPFPEVSVVQSDDALSAGCKVVGAGNYKPGKKVTLKATAAKGWVFAGWSGIEDLDWLSALAPTVSQVINGDDIFAFADFIPVSEDWLEISEPYLSNAGFAAELPLKVEIDEETAALIYDLIDTGSHPTVQVAGLPAGLKFSSSTFLLSGKPTKSGVYHVTVSAKNAGGYTFVRVFDMAVLDERGEVLPEKPLENAADVDFSPLESLMTGVRYSASEVVLSVPASPETGAAVKKVSVSGLPTGLKSAVRLTDEGTAEIEITGVPTKPGRFTVSLSVNYVAGKSARSSLAVVVQDGGSRYLFVEALSDGGSLSGEGVYAAGQTVKLAAKSAKGYAFAGWFDYEGGQLSATGVDYRTTTVTLPFCEGDLSDYPYVGGVFVLSADDKAVDVAFEKSVWEIDPAESSRFGFVVDSFSLPKLTVKGLPKGVVMDAVSGCFRYEPASSTVPGVYHVTLTVKNTSLSKPATFEFEIRVANRVSEVIHGVDPSIDAYPLTVGVTVDPEMIVPSADGGWSLSVKGLPSGLAYVNGAVTGIPTKAGDYTVTVTATTGKGASKRTETATFTLRIESFPAQLVGSYSGLAYDELGDAGSFSCTVSPLGKISAKVKFADRNMTFSKIAGSSYIDGVVRAVLEGTGGAALELALDAEVGWEDWQLSGEAVIGGRVCALRAQRNPYGAKDGVEEARSELRELVGTFALGDGLKLKVSAEGSATLSGKYDGKAISGTSILQYDDGGFEVNFVIFRSKTETIVIRIRFEEDRFVIDSIDRHII